MSDKIFRKQCTGLKRYLNIVPTHFQENLSPGFMQLKN